MQNINFGNNLEIKEEKVFQGYSAKATGIYNWRIEKAFLTVSSRGTSGIAFKFVDKNQESFEHTLWFTNTNGDVFSIIDGVQKPRAMYSLLDNLAFITCQTSFRKLLENAKTQTIAVYDKEAGKEIPKEVPVLTQLQGKVASFGIIKEIQNHYNDASKPQEQNTFNMVFQAKTKLTATEIRAGITEPDLYYKWEAQYTSDFVRDNFDPNKAQQQKQVGVDPFEQIPDTAPSETFNENTETTSDFD